HDTMLLDLIMIRGNLATLLDTLFPGDSVRGIVPQVLLDMLVTSLDRGIDLLALGAEPGINAATEVRAVTYWLIAVAIIRALQSGYNLTPPLRAQTVSQTVLELSLEHYINENAIGEVGGTLERLQTADPAINRVFARLELVLTEALRNPRWRNPHAHRAIREELMVQRSLERRWRDLVRTVAPEAANQETVFEWLQVVVRLAMHLGEVHLPPHR